MSPPNDQVNLSRDVALLLLEMLNRAAPDGSIRPIDSAEQRALWDFECELERLLPEPLLPNYADLVNEAKQRLRDPEESAPQPGGAGVVFVDVDDTLVRSFGSKRIPMQSVIDRVCELRATGVELYCWSSGGREYAHRAVVNLGIAGSFRGFVPKPNVMIDDQAPADWRTMRCLHPNEAVSMTAEEISTLARRAAG